MPANTAIREKAQRKLEELQLRLARPDALLLLSVLGLVTGLLAGAVIIAFRLVVEGTQIGFLPGGESENYEGLSDWLRFFLPVAGGLLIGVLFHMVAGKRPPVLGVARVMEVLAYHQGHHRLPGFLLQFLGAAIAIISGHSVGREAPHVYLGAASGSLLGQWLSVPNNSIRTMVGCGTAAAIAASFNTPLAGVIFALEVVMMEYTLASFIPVILAAVAANSLSVGIFGAEPAFQVPFLEMGSLWEMPAVLLLGLVIGCVAAGFLQLLQFIARHSQPLPFWCRTSLAGLIVGLCALPMPEIMGVGYDTVNTALLGNLGLGVLLALVLFKIVASAASGGLGIPGGMIAPSLFIGATVGGLVGLLVETSFPGVASSPGLYALLGMGAMMGASLQAPLAGLTAIMELTHNPQIVMPGMLVIVVAALTAGELFGKESIFITILKSNGLDYSTNPVLQALRRVGVGSVMSQRFVRQQRELEPTRAKELLDAEPEWLLIDEEGLPKSLMPGLELARHIEAEHGTEVIDLIKIPARRLEIAPLNLQATLQEALETLNQTGAEALYVERMTVPGIKRIYGILTREQIESAYRY